MHTIFLNEHQYAVLFGHFHITSPELDDGESLSIEIAIEHKERVSSFRPFYEFVKQVDACIDKLDAAGYPLRIEDVLSIELCIGEQQGQTDDLLRMELVFERLPAIGEMYAPNNSGVVFEVVGKPYVRNGNWVAYGKMDGIVFLMDLDGKMVRDENNKVITLENGLGV
ncbi:hypothetical protein [Vibrio crassostreae]|uniref:hypothetical protein n=1 Tax=Vibrio crassostreae TaxID=246167 RepID=UPI001B30ABE3|nr:hypothetical protein [Vibrio crassostreae]